MRVKKENATGPARWLEDVGSRNTLWLAAISLTLFVLLLPSASYVAALPFIKQEWGLNNTQAGTVYSGYMAGYALSALLVIPMTDRLATKYIFLASAVISVTTQVLFPLAADGMISGTVLMAFAGVGLWGSTCPDCGSYQSGSGTGAGGWPWGCSSRSPTAHMPLRWHPPAV